MENLDWEGAQVFMDTPSLWNSEQNDMQESIIITNSNLYAYNGKEEIPYLNSNAPGHVSNSAKQENEIFHQQEVPAISFSALPSYSEIGFGSENQAFNFENGNSSLYCLLSGTNSNTDTSVDQDVGMSMMFSDYTNLWNFGSQNNYASSNARNKDETSYAQRKKIINPAKRKISDHIIQNGSSKTEVGFQLISETHQQKAKKLKKEKLSRISNISFQQPKLPKTSSVDQESDPETTAHIKQMVYRAAAFRPVNFGLEVVEKPKRKNVRISTEPQTVAARERRERISERIRILQKLVPGGSKLDTASMLDEAANYLKFLRAQVKALESLGHKLDNKCPNTSTSGNLDFSSLPFDHSVPMQNLFSPHNPYHAHQKH